MHFLISTPYDGYQEQERLIQPMKNRSVKTALRIASTALAFSASALLQAQQSSQTGAADATLLTASVASPSHPLNLALDSDTHSSLSSSLSTDAADDQQSMPSAPVPQSNATQEYDHTDKQTSRILGIIPNFRAVSANVQLPPQSIKDKFVTASEDSFDYSSIVLPAFVAGVNLGRNNTPEFGHGGVGYGRYLWHSVVDQTSENYMVEFIVPSLTREDTRYYTLGSGGFTKRAGYALSRAVVTRTDSGHRTFNVSEVFGAGAAAGLSNLYYPHPERTVSNTMDQWGLDVGIDAFTFMVKEFWPDINHYLFHGDKPFKDATQGSPNPAK